MAFFIIFCGKYARASDNLLRLPSIAKYSHERLDEAVRETNAVPMNPYLITETDDIGDVTIDERAIVIGTGGGDCAGLNAFIQRVVLRAAELNAKLEPSIPVAVEFVADKTGTFQFRCNLPCGSGHTNMKGTIVVK